MGFGLKKTFGRVVSGIGKLTGNLGNAFFGKPGTSGPQNPFSPPNLDFLKNTEGKFDFLKTPKTFASTYVAPTGTSDAFFNDLIGNINAPSSVDAVRSDVEGQRLQSVLSGIDEDIARSSGNLKADFADRGLSGAGVASDLETNALGTAQVGGVKAKTDARLAAMLAELDRVKAKETAAREAYGSRYNAGVTADTQARDIASRGALADVAASESNQGRLADIINNRDTTLAQLLENLYSGGAQREIAGRKQGTNGIFDNILRNTNISFGF